MEAATPPAAEHSDAPESPPVADGTGSRQFPCDGCGANLEFHIGQQQLKCPYCGHSKELTFAEDAKIEEQDLEAALARLAKRRREGATGAVFEREVDCKGCGATTTFSGEMTTSECPFCGLHLQRNDVHQAEERIAVDAVLPFLVDKKAAGAKLEEWVKGLWFAPSDFKARGVGGKFNGLYLPFWTFDAMTFTRYRGKRGDNYQETIGSGDKKRTVTRTRWTPKNGSFDRFFDDVAVCAAAKVEKSLIEALTPWPIDKATPFNQELIAGYQAMTYDIELSQGLVAAKSKINEELENDVRGRIGGDKQEITSLDTAFSALTYKHTLFPVWMLAYQYDGEPYQVVINAATGEVQGERPWSTVKIALAILTALVCLGYVWWRSR